MLLLHESLRRILWPVSFVKHISSKLFLLGENRNPAECGQPNMFTATASTVFRQDFQLWLLYLVDVKVLFC